MAIIEQSYLLFDIALMIIFATLLAYASKLFRQPLIPAYIIAGVILGPTVLGLIQNQSVIYTLSEIGIAFMLFIVGLEMNFNKLKQVGLIASLGGLAQVIVTFVLGYLVGHFLGFNVLVSIYLGLIVAFSSTMVVVKYLSDKEELHTLHGRIILGILLMQDILVVIALSMLGTFNEGSTISAITIAVLKGLGLFAFAALLTRGILRGFFKLAAESQELLFLCSITFCFLFSALAIYLGFSIIVGAFIAGLVLATLPYNRDIIGRIKPLKDFFATLFFVSLGMQLFFDNLNAITIPLMWLCLIVIVAKPLVIMIITSLFGYGKRTSFLTSISLAQISEFSLVLTALGVSLGHLTNEIFSLVIILAGITLTLTAYLVQYDSAIYKLFSRPLSIFEKFGLQTKKLGTYTRGKHYDVIMFGCHRMGNIFLDMFNKMKKKILVVDYNPDTIDNLTNANINCLYGDIKNSEILHEARLNKAKIVLSTVPDYDDNKGLIRYVRKRNKNALIFVTANHLGESLDLYKEGADYVIQPHIFTAEGLHNLFKKSIGKRSYIKAIKKRHLNHLIRLETFVNNNASARI